MECSIVASVYNGLSYTRLFVESVLACSDAPYELILVDDGSTDDTPAYLADLAHAHGHVTVLRNEANQGIARAWNRGLAAARGRTIALCNNDIVVSPGWLSRLVSELEVQEHHGIVSPASNQVVWSYIPERFPDERAWMEGRPGPGPSRESLQSYYGDFYGFANHFSQKYAGLRVALCYAPCMVIRRETLEDIGGFDEGFGQAFYEDVDFFQRTLLNQRYNLVETYGSVYVHHFVGGTVIPLGVPRLTDQTGPNFQRKWHPIHGDLDLLAAYHNGQLDREGLLRLRAELLDRLPPPLPLWR